MKFYKYQGAGNDFVMIDNRGKLFPSTTQFVSEICHRKFGIGADGLILIENSSIADFKMVYYNADGNESTMCGNGGRCIVAFAKELNIISDETTFEAVDGIHRAKIKDNQIHLEMISVRNITIADEAYIINTGSPHYVSFVEENIQSYPVYQSGYNIRNSEPFKKDGINVNFVSIKGDEIFVRTFERGVEDETLSCGTGVTAAAIATFFKTGKKPSLIHTLGGKLQVTFDEKNQMEFENVWLIGPAEKVFEGKLNIS